jgi:hypothetical protein
MDEEGVVTTIGSSIEGTRFDFARNLAVVPDNHGSRSLCWPPQSDYHLIDCVLSVPDGPIAADLVTLRQLVEASRSEAVSVASPPASIPNATAIAAQLRRIAARLPKETDRIAVQLRADALEHGYDETILAALASSNEQVTFVAGNIATWFGKQRQGLPTAFGCAAEAEQQAAVDGAAALQGEIDRYLRGLHSALRLKQVPAFAATSLFFMAGEGDGHPKHIAYFLPEDEGVKRSTFKKTYYFANVHRQLIEAAALPLSRRLLELGMRLPATAAALGAIPTLGVYAHEMGHAVQRETTSFAALNAADRWASVMLQEMAADVFGTLILTEVIAPALGIEPRRMIAYHLGECLRYVDRGLGCFADSDGMYLQLSYMARFGALELHDGAAPRLSADPEVLLAGFRSLGRVLADTLLANDVDRSLALYRDFGAGARDGRLSPLLAALAAEPPPSLAYRMPLTGQPAQKGHAA